MINCVVINGYLSADVEIAITPSGSKVCSFSLACYGGRKNPNGDGYHTEWIRCKAWGNNAEILENHKKGERVSIQGHLCTDSYEKNGKKTYTTYIFATGVEVHKVTAKTTSTAPTVQDDLSLENDFGPSLDISSDDLPF